MALVEMVMPKMGESIMEGTVLRWLKQVGDRIEEDESVLEVATDKVDTEVPAIEGGILTKILANEGDVIPVGQAIALIDTTGDGTAPSSEPATEITGHNPEPTAAPVAAVNSTPTVATPEKAEPAPSPAKAKQVFEGRFYSPLVMNIAREENISMAELEQIPGTGSEGRVTKKDILEYLENRHEAQDNKAAAAPETANPVETTAPVSTPAKETSRPVAAPEPNVATQPAVSVSGNVEIIEMDRMRKMIAQRMVDSKRIAPHVTSFVEADVTNIVMWRNKMKEAYQKTRRRKFDFHAYFH